MNKQVIRNILQHTFGNIFKKSEKDPIDTFIKRVKTPYITVTHCRDRAILAEYMTNQALDSCISERTSVKFQTSFYDEA